MSNKNLSFRDYILPFLAIVLIVQACDQTEDPLPEVRLFRPVSADIESTGGTWFSAEWDRIKGAVSYTAEISVDSFEIIYKSVEIDTNYVLFENLEEEMHYFLRVRANAENPEFNSHWAFMGKVWVGRMPTILLKQDFKETTSTSVVARWKAETDIPTHLEVIKRSDNSVIKEIELTGDDLAAEMVEITGLAPNTLYK
ncbi:MAG TPA: hypothetical protein ENO05_07900, partial [Bacteroides sp.]|nr:hypothetical protein [Bacteroides sp.]